ncbi:Metallo-dependent phosphatase [Guyanagaster necrorhizus]|uniref:Metallo-dependent phosphatase n=1 Tax=Guyanagaster necrorhizus TaxID=856835 RepID=A0A9P7VYJ7_9AGAR|nr:Metallo-dependent phosphatase [Guyanagaster necrorhizus MCA 3950]KAG7449563.1 Metallo-dependent phosphatase [Guyanagaster necrorhizus MCA 3950]
MENHLGAVVLESDTEVVYVEYDSPFQLPPPPSDEWTRFVCISDTHSHTFDVPWGDVLIHSGDLTNTGTLKEFEKTMEWIRSLPHRTKVIIAGNHDLTLDRHDDWYERNYQGWHMKPENLKPIFELLKGPKATEAGIFYLQDESHIFQAKDGGRAWSVYGSPWSPEFCDWAFNYDRRDGKRLISQFPKTDILQALTHGPPLGIFDLTSSCIRAGCRDLTNRLPYLRPRIHLFGHIHEGHGAYVHEWSSGSTETPDGGDRTVFVNAANWPMGRHSWGPKGRTPFGGPGFRPIVVDLKD